jgi:hypothetical protein
MEILTQATTLYFMKIWLPQKVFFIFILLSFEQK